MSDDERVLRSFVAEDEEWLGSWSITQIKRSKGHLPPSPAGAETVAVTEDRLLWFQNELDDVTLADVENVESEYIEQQAAPPMVMGGGLLFVLGVFASIGAFVAGVGDTLVVSMPALTGLAIFLGARVVASVTGQEGDTREGHRMRLWTDGEPVTIWAHDEDVVDELEAAILAVLDGSTAGDTEPTAEAGAEDGSDTAGDSSAAANEDVVTSGEETPE